MWLRQCAQIGHLEHGVALRQGRSTHAAQDDVGFAAQIAVFRVFTEIAWARYHRCQFGRLLLGQFVGRFVEMVLGSRFGTKHIRPPFNHVQVNLKNALFVCCGFHHQGNGGFFGLAHIGFAFPQKQILGQLLRNGRATCFDFARALVALHRVFNAAPIKTIVIGKGCVFRSNDGLLQIVADVAIRHPIVFDGLIAVLQRAGAHEAGRFGCKRAPKQNIAIGIALKHQYQTQHASDEGF